MKLTFPAILIIIVSFGLAFFFLQMLIPLIQVRTEGQDQESFDARFFGYGSSQTIVFNFTQMAAEGDGEGGATLERIKKTLASCETVYLDLLYSRGKMVIAIDDDQNMQDDELCSMAISHWSHGMFTSLDCLPPGDKLAKWDGWKHGESADVSQIKQYCKVISLFYVGEIVPAET